MENLFKSVEDKGHTAKLEMLKRNIAFAQLLVRDLEEAFEVQIEHKRCEETRMQIVAYAPHQSGRYGWGFTFEATPDGVSFRDGRGIRLELMATILKAKILKNDYNSDKKANDLALAKAAEKIGVQIIRVVDSACGDHFTIKTALYATDKHLQAKLKIIVATMKAQNVVSRL